MPIRQEKEALPIKPSDSYDIGGLKEAFVGLGYKLLFSDETESTMDDARTAGITPTVVLTDHQTKGRGRVGKSWLDLPGMSILMTIAEPFNEIDGDPKGNSFFPPQMFTLAAAIALQDITENPYIQVKWPNDLVYVEYQETFGRKIGGVLTENPDHTTYGTYPKLFGIGINVHYHCAQETFPATDYGAISLSEIAQKKSFRRQDIAIAIMKEWSKARIALRGITDPETFDRYNTLWIQSTNFLKEKRVKISGLEHYPKGTFEGVIIDIPLGKPLQLRTINGIQEFTEFNSNTKIEIIN